jgi:hypothetical protein
MLTLFVFLLFVMSFGRYLQGKWKHMRVIEQDAGAAGDVS